MTDHTAAATCQHGADLASTFRHSSVAGEVDATVQPVQSTGSQATLDRGIVNAGGM